MEVAAATLVSWLFSLREEDFLFRNPLSFYGVDIWRRVGCISPLFGIESKLHLYSSAGPIEGFVAACELQQVGN